MEEHLDFWCVFDLGVDTSPNASIGTAREGKPACADYEVAWLSRWNMILAS